MRDVPELRFDGFEGEWEEKKLKETSKIVGGGTPSTKNKEYWDGDINWFTPSEIDSRRYFSSSERKITEKALSKSSAKLLDKNKTVLFTSRATIGEVGLLKEDSTTNQGFQSLVIKDDFDLNFMYSIAQTLKRKALSLSVGSTFKEISKSSFEDIEIYTPIKNEQEKIGDLFKKIDALIEIQETKISKMEDFKKSMLQKMFPKKGEIVPKFRFDGFDGEWNMKALGDLSEISTGKLDANAMVIGGEYDFYTSGIEKYKIDNYAFEGPSITVAGNGATVGYMHLADGKFNAYQRTYVIQKIKGDRIFIFYQIQSKLPRKIHEESRQGNIPYIVMNMLTDLYLDVPEIQEQAKIGQFFKKLDIKIENEEKLLDSYKMMKKSLLQKMFV